MRVEIQTPESSRSLGAITRRLVWSAGLSCGFCAGLVFLLEGEHRLGVQHFVGWPFLLLFVGMIAAIVACLGFAAENRIRRRHEEPSAFWLLVGLAPVAFWGAVGFYGFACWSTRYVPNNFLMNLARRSGATLMEAEAVWNYRNRIGSRRLVMFYNDLARPEVEAAAMERHLEDLETILGRPMRSRIHWVRGPLLGQGGLSLYGLALGSPGGGSDPGPSQTDRHEAAHAFMTQTLAADADVPTVLAEGWAQAVAYGWLAQRSDPAAMAMDLIEVRQSPGCPPMAELFGPAWYHKDAGFVYQVGPHLVRHLIRHHGPEKFIGLCATIRPGQAGEAFRQAYGADLSSLERAMIREAEETLRHLQAGQAP